MLKTEPALDRSPTASLLGPERARGRASDARLGSPAGLAVPGPRDGVHPYDAPLSQLAVSSSWSTSLPSTQENRAGGRGRDLACDRTVDSTRVWGPRQRERSGVLFALSGFGATD